MSSGGGSGFLSSPLEILPLHPLHRETLPKTNTSQKGESTQGRCWGLIEKGCGTTKLEFGEGCGNTKLEFGEGWYVDCPNSAGINGGGPLKMPPTLLMLMLWTSLGLITSVVVVAGWATECRLCWSKAVRILREITLKRIIICKRILYTFRFTISCDARVASCHAELDSSASVTNFLICSAPCLETPLLLGFLPAVEGFPASARVWRVGLVLHGTIPLKTFVHAILLNCKCNFVWTQPHWLVRQALLITSKGTFSYIHIVRSFATVTFDHSCRLILISRSFNNCRFIICKIVRLLPQRLLQLRWECQCISGQVESVGWLTWTVAFMNLSIFLWRCSVVILNHLGDSTARFWYSFLSLCSPELMIARSTSFLCPSISRFIFSIKTCTELLPLATYFLIPLHWCSTVWEDSPVQLSRGCLEACS